MQRKFLLHLTLIPMVALLLNGTATAAEHYVHATRGSDTAAGTATAPWKSLEKARNTARPGDTVIVAEGNYGVFSESQAARSAFLTFKAAAGKMPRLDGISLTYGSPSNSYLRFDGFDIYSPSRQTLIYIERARHVQILNSQIHAQKWATAGRGVYGADVRSSEDILFERNSFFEVFRGALVRNSVRPILRRNHIRPSAGTGIQYLDGNVNGVIEYNHIQGAVYQSRPQNPDAVVDPHASIISMRSGNVTIRGNHMHGMGSSSGVMFYEPDSVGGEDAYSNVVFENNLIYDVSNAFGLRIYNLGTNFVIRNNLITSQLRSGTCNGLAVDSRYRYSTALAVHNLGRGQDGSGLQLHNNILIGIVNVPAKIKEGNNVVWSWQDSGWRSASPSGTSRIITSGYGGGCGSHSTFFEKGFFRNPIDFRFPSLDPVDFSLATPSPWVSFGNPATQPPTTQGSIGPDGFMLDGAVRSAQRHSVGPFEPRLPGLPTSGTPPLPPVLLEAVPVR